MQHDDMTEGDCAAIGGAAVAGRLADMRARLAALFGAMLDGSGQLRHAVHPPAPRLAAPLGRLAVALQAGDATDQRLAHLEAAALRLVGLDDVSRRAAGRVMGRQIAALAVALAETAGQVAAELAMLARHTPGDGPRAALERTGAAAAALGAEAEGVAAFGADLDARAGAVDAGLDSADLDWLRALYTMDAEREVHARAVA